MIEDEFFKNFFNELEKEIDDTDYIINLKKLIASKKLSKTQYEKLIRGSNH